MASINLYTCEDCVFVVAKIVRNSFFKTAFIVLSRMHGRLLGAQFGGTGRKFRGPNFRMTFLGTNFHFNAQNSLSPFLVVNPILPLSCLSLLSKFCYITL